MGNVYLADGVNMAQFNISSAALTFFDNVNGQFIFSVGTNPPGLIFPVTVTFEDWITALLPNGQKVELYGTGLSVTGNVITGGTLTAIQAGGMTIHNLSSDAADLAAAMATAATGDDRAALAAILPEDDRVRPSFVEAVNYTAFGGAGDDWITGSAGRDSLSGDGGNDTVEGDAGADRLVGGAGKDRMNGGAGGDRLDGGAGQDRLSGDGGTDRFVFLAGETGKGIKADRITDFGGKDRLDLTGIDADTGRGGEQDLNFTGKTATAHSVWYVTAGDDVIVRIDVNGNTGADMEIRLSDISRLNSGDFV